jgi:hypothetical protein
MLGDDFSLAVQDRATGVLGLANDRRVTGAEERVLHLLDDAGETGLDDLKSYGIDRWHITSSFDWNVWNVWNYWNITVTVPIVPVVPMVAL